jgi:hypothetical protein
MHVGEISRERKLYLNEEVGYSHLTTFEPGYIESLSNIGFKMFMMG